MKYITTKPALLNVVYNLILPQTCARNIKKKKKNFCLTVFLGI